jgi:hypothetical protein
MTSAQAKAVLIAYRPGTDDATDPDVAAALALCAQDEMLAQWWAAERAQQAALRGKLVAIPVPPGLAEQIISERRARFTIPRWRQPALVAAGCAVVLLVGLSVWFSFQSARQPDVSFDGYRARMVKTALRVYGMDLETNEAAQVRAFLAQQNAPADYELPPGLEQAETVGCGVLRWQDKPVSMICFRTGQPLPPGAKTDLMLFVIQRDDVQGEVPRAATEIVGISQLSTATWQAGDKVYLLAAFDATELQKRL